MPCDHIFQQNLHWSRVEILSHFIGINAEFPWRTRRRGHLDHACMPPTHNRLPLFLLSFSCLHRPAPFLIHTRKGVGRCKHENDNKNSGKRLCPHSQSLATVFIIILVFTSPRPLPCISYTRKGAGRCKHENDNKNSDCAPTAQYIPPPGSRHASWHTWVSKVDIQGWGTRTRYSYSQFSSTEFLILVLVLVSSKVTLLVFVLVLVHKY